MSIYFPRPDYIWSNHPVASSLRAARIHSFLDLYSKNSNPKNQNQILSQNNQSNHGDHCILQMGKDLLMYSSLSDNPKGVKIEKKIEFPENLAGRVIFNALFHGFQGDQYGVYVHTKLLYWNAFYYVSQNLSLSESCLNTTSMRDESGYEIMKKAIGTLGLSHKEHIAAYGEGNNTKLLTSTPLNGSMRDESGYEIIKKAIGTLELSHKEHIAAYGEGNNAKLLTSTPLNGGSLK